jgi:hypothetical protein
MLNCFQGLLSNSTCATTTWGRGKYGQLGHGGAVQVDPIKPELKARQVSALETKM